SPAPLSPSNATPGSGIQGAAVGRSQFTLVSELPSADSLGWIPDGSCVTTGNNVDAGLDIDAINAVDIEPRIDVIARRNARAVRNPSQAVGARQLAHQGELRPPYGGPLNAAPGCRVRRRERRRTVARIDVERGCLRLILRNVFSEEHLTARVVDDHVIGRDGLPEQHSPRQDALGRPEGEDDELDGDVVRK